MHLVFDAGPDPVGTLAAQDDKALLGAVRERALALLDHGVTTVRDLGDRGRLTLGVRDAIARGEIPGPRIMAATTPLTTRGGHCWFLGGETEGEEQVRTLVRRNAAAGADVIKVMASGGGLARGGPPTWQAQFRAAELAAAVDEAHRAGLRVAAHARGTDGIAAAVTAGVDTLELHLDDQGRLRSARRPAGHHRRQRHRRLPYRQPELASAAAVFGAERAETIGAHVRAAAERGARLIAGTDAGVQRAGFGGLATALGYYRHLGLANDRIIDMATVHAADALGLADRTGRLAAGQCADVLAVAGDPLTDLAALGSVRLVMAGGRLHRIPTDEVTR